MCFGDKRNKSETQELFSIPQSQWSFSFSRKLISNNSYDTYYDILHRLQIFKNNDVFGKLLFTVFSIFKVVVF